MAEEGKPAFGIGSFLWSECWTRDIAKSKEFWSKVAGWTYEEMDMGPAGIYHILKAGEESAGGMAEMKGEEWGEMPPHWAYYIDVEDVDASLARVRELGGNPVGEPTEVPSVGRFCPIAAPDGSHVFLMTPAERATETPNPGPGQFMWVELMSRDWDRARAFYCELLGWQAQDMPMPDGKVYTVFQTANGNAAGGLAMPGDVPAEVPSSWTGYIHVVDLDDALGKVEAAGGQILMPAMEVENVGRFATIMDSAGASVAMMKPAPM